MLEYPHAFEFAHTRCRLTFRSDVAGADVRRDRREKL